MRTSIFAILATLGSLAVAQDILGSLPKCGQKCFGNNFAGCDQFAYACICGNKDLIAQLSCCVSTKCNDQDKSTIITLASGLCKAYGVDVPTVASCAASASPTAASSASSGSAASSGSTSARGSSTTAAPTSTSASGSQTAAAQSSTAGSSTGSPGAAGALATAHAGLGMAVGMAGLLAAL